MGNACKHGVAAENAIARRQLLMAFAFSSWCTPKVAQCILNTFLLVVLFVAGVREDIHKLSAKATSHHVPKSLANGINKLRKQISSKSECFAQCCVSPAASCSCLGWLVVTAAPLVVTATGNQQPHSCSFLGLNRFERMSGLLAADVQLANGHFNLQEHPNYCCAAPTHQLCSAYRPG
jgi:hypothetical protein